MADNETTEGNGLTVHTLVAEAIKDSGKLVQERLVHILAEKELDKRVQAALQCLEHIDKARNELRRIKPDVLSYNEDGSVASSSYKKETVENRKKLAERIEKGTKAYDKAITTGDFSDVHNFNQKYAGGGTPISDAAFAT